MTRLGGWFTIIGGGVLAVVLVATALAMSGQDVCTAPKEPPSDKLMVYAADGKFGVNDQLCIGWRPKLFFAKELLVSTERAAAVEKAIAVRNKAIQAAAAATPADKAAREAELKTAQAELMKAEASYNELPTEAKVIIFIDDKPTELGFAARMPEPNDKDEWAWQPVPVRAPDDHASEAAMAWRGFLGGVSRDGSRAVKVSLGDPEAKLPRKGADITSLSVSAFDRTWLLIGSGGFVLTMAGIVMLGSRSLMLRTRRPTSASDKPPFSLARTQMVWWFVLTLAGFLFIWLTTGQWRGVMNAEVVGLLGVSGVSGLAAVAIDKTPATAPAAGSPAANDTSKGFFFDILSDGESIVLPRVQMFAWTIVLGLIFAWTVFWKYAFPQFDPTLLALTGFVNSLYIGFKLPENKPPPPTALPQDGAAAVAAAAPRAPAARRPPRRSP